MLITLAIIGIVAAMTISTLMHKIHTKQLEVAFNSAYSILSQAINYMVLEDGPGLTKRYAIYVPGSGYLHMQKFKDLFYNSSQIKVLGTCNYSKPVRNYTDTKDAYTTHLYHSRGTLKNAMANGMCVEVSIDSYQIFIVIDTNGTKKPNKLGHDVFYFNISDKDALSPSKMTKFYTDEELEEMKANGAAFTFVLGSPCSMQSTQSGNGSGCAWYAKMNICPDDETKGYWECLPN